MLDDLQSPELLYPMCVHVALIIQDDSHQNCPVNELPDNFVYTS